MVSCASWLRPPAPSTICVLVGLPFTTKVPDRPAAALASAEADEVDVLVERLVVLRRVGARRRRALGEDHDEDRHGGAQQRRRTRSSSRRGSRSAGSPLGTGPSVATPWAARSPASS